MNFRLGMIALALGGAFALTAGCAVEAGDEADAEEAAASEDELHASARRLVGAYHGEGAARPPSFEGIVFQADGTFFADVDTGIRCITTPCPSHVRLEGRYTATRNYLRLRPATGKTEGFYGRFRYQLSGDRLTLSRSDWKGWKESFAKEISYCAQADDCWGQNLIHPMCMGGWTCGASNQCGWQCGVWPPPPPASDIWPADATKLVADSPGGGFTPPPPPGSTCAIGKQRFTLDVATKELAWELCDWQGPTQPLHLVTGTKVLSAAEYQSIDDAMRGVTVATEEICGADKPLLTLRVSSPGGEKTYTDSFYSCWGEGRTYVDNIDAVFGAMRDAAH